MIEAFSASSMFDQAFGTHEHHRTVMQQVNADAKRGDVSTVLWRCLVAKDISARDSQFEYTKELGSGTIDDILHKRPVSCDKSLAFYFPERYMSPWEQQRFTWCIAKHPQFAGLGLCVDILTGSPLIVGSFRREEVRILQNDELRAAQVAAWGS